MTDRLIAIQGSDGIYRKIARITPLADGGWSLIPGYEPKPHPGWLLTEFTPDYVRGTHFTTSRSDLRRENVTSGGIKLSIHGNGFVQFSRTGRTGLLSGRDPGSRAPRGFGLYSFPVTNPPRSGPMFGMQAWGIDPYPTTFPRGQRIDIRPDDLYHQYPDRDIERNGYALEFWPFPRNKLHHAHRRGDVLVMPGFRHPHYGRALVEFVVVDADHPLMCLGVVVTAHYFDSSVPTGVVLSTPSDRKMERIMKAYCPILADRPAPSADYDDAWPSLPPGRAVFLQPKSFTPIRLDRPWGRKR